MDLQEKKNLLINSLIAEGVLKTKEIIEAFRRVRREDFVLSQYKEHAYVDEPLPLPANQTISQPFTVASMTEALQPKSGQKILEVGAGSGYQAAILLEIVGPKGSVVTVERIHELAKLARSNLQKTGYKNAKIIEGDGTMGYEKEAPYDRIIVTASSPGVPEPLLKQLKENGRLVIPVGDRMMLVEKEKGGKIRETFLGYYAFVPLIGKHGHKN